MADSDKLPRPPLVLVANDQEWAARSLESILGPNGYAVLRAYTGRQALELARTAQPDALVLDARLPDMGGVDVCMALRDDPRIGLTTPVIMTTAGPSERAKRLEAYEAGAWEFYSQPLDGEMLLLKLRTFMRAKRETDRLRDESLLDEVTGLYNMRGLVRRAHEIGAEAQRRHEPVACVAFAPDALAESYSSALTDAFATRAAVHLGSIAQRAGRVSDAIGRLGQTEFALVAPATESQGAVQLVERLRESLEASPLSVDGSEQIVRLRAGYYAVRDFSESTVDVVEMLMRATSALRQLRAEGNGGYIKAFEEALLKRGP
jgi:two-component system cell cycle response regulator